MKLINYLVFFPLFFLIKANNDFHKEEIEIALEIFKKLKISHCVLVIDTPKLVTFNYKRIYNHSILISHIRLNFFKEFFYNAQSFYFKIGFVVKMDAIKVLKDLFDNDPVGVAKFTWLMFGNENVGLEFIIPYNCEFFNVELVEKNEYFIKGIYYIKNSGPFMTDFGVWSNASGLVLNAKFDTERKDLRGVTLIRGDSYGFVKGTTCNNFTIERKHREIWDEYTRLLNFSFVVVKEGMYNDPKAPDGTPCVMVQHSLNYFPDAVYPTCFMPLYMVIKFESDIGEGWKAYFKPFDNWLWCSVFGLGIISVISFKIVEYFGRIILNPFAVFYAFCCQDGLDVRNEKLKSLSSLIVYLMPHFAASVIIPAYSAAILAKLTVQLPKVPFTDLQGFAQDGTYKVTSLNNTFANMYFSRSQHQLVSRIYREMYVRKEEYPNIDSEAISKLCTQKKFAFIPYHVEKFESESYCKIFKVPKLILHLYCGFKLKVNSTFKHVFTKQLIRLYAAGIMKRKLEHEFNEEASTVDEETFDPITISQVMPILNIMPLGMFLSLTSLIIEILKKREKTF